MGQSHFLELNGLRFHYIEWGKTSAPAMVMLHGLRAYARTWEKTAQHFENEFRILALDQRGRGKSDWDPEANYYTDAYVADLEAFVDAIGLERFILVGHSMGGTNAYVYTGRHPGRVRCAIVEDIGPGSSTEGPGYERILREVSKTPSRFDSWDAGKRYWRGLRPHANEEAVAQRVAETLKENADGEIVWRFDWGGIQDTRLNPDPSRVVDLWPVIENLTRPVLVLRGELSDFLPVQTCISMAEKNSNIRWTEIPNASHYAHDDNFECFVRELASFVHECE